MNWLRRRLREAVPQSAGEWLFMAAALVLAPAMLLTANSAVAIFARHSQEKTVMVGRMKNGLQAVALLCLMLPADNANAITPQCRSVFLDFSEASSAYKSATAKHNLLFVQYGNTAKGDIPKADRDKIFAVSKELLLVIPTLRSAARKAQEAGCVNNIDARSQNALFKQLDSEEEIARFQIELLKGE
jgi:hypothetical protein